MRRPIFTFDRTFAFEQSAAELWASLTEVGRYQQVWPWLVRFDLTAIREDETAQCAVQAPLPYRIHFEVRLDEVTQGRLIAGRVDGDIRGPARLEISGGRADAQARLSWELVVQRPLLRGLATVARPALEWGHDHIVEQGLRQFPAHQVRATDDPTRSVG